MLNTLSFIRRHPLTRSQPLTAVARFAAWQVGSRLKKVHTHSWIAGSKLVVENGMTGATGNIYWGLHEFADMAFVLHLLREGDLFLDIGANVGSYTVLASAVCGARTLAFEPDPDTAARLARNINANGIGAQVTVIEAALGAEDREISFTAGLDTVNQVAASSQAGPTRTVSLRRLDGVAGSTDGVLIKLDVEGYEAQVLAGAEAVLAAPSLLAIETELDAPDVIGTLTKAGFARRFYDPLSRTLSDRPPEAGRASNALFIRNEAAVLARVTTAPRRRILNTMV
jgi:FkbM family methyltransferase